jgi:maleate isomerase
MGNSQAPPTDQKWERNVMSKSMIKHVEAALDAGMADQVVIGLIALSTDVVTESELRKMLPSDGVSISATRIETHNPITIENLRGHAHEIAKPRSYSFRESA